MSIFHPIKNKIRTLKEEYDRLKRGKESLLKLLYESELSESVYNSNAIENFTLTLPETEKILLEMKVSKKLSLREVFEAKNLAGVMEYVSSKSITEELSKEMILLLHKMLLGNINDSVSGRFRIGNEYVRIGSYIASSPEHIGKRLEKILLEYNSNQDIYFLERISRFHLEFETIHPLVDGNGRIGRVIINYQLIRQGFPEIIIRNKEKKEYYSAFTRYQNNKNVREMEKQLSLSLIESFHKRIAYLKGQMIITAIEYAKQVHKPVPVVLNAAKRQAIPAFREKGKWKVGID